jgi:hypothetical protein
MSDTHSNLVQEWRDAAAATMRAQKEVDACFEGFVAGAGPAPERSQLDELARLQKLEHECLLRAMNDLERKANGMPVAPRAPE